MVKPVFRRKSIGTKVSEEEYARLEALAGGRALGEWVREVLLREADGRRTEEIVLAEVLALRTILLNAFYKLAQGEKLTEEGMQAIIDRADATKVQKAAERILSEPQYQACKNESDRQMARCALLDLSRNGRIKLIFVRYDENRRNVVPEDISKELSRKPAPAQ
jgi:hypothetical protein